MIHLTIPLPLSLADRQELQGLQQAVNNQLSYPEKVVFANQRWNSKPTQLFERVRTALEVTCIGARRCSYCEDSMGDEIEHIRPKSWFPEQTFEPTNYLLACGPCNSPKGNQYATVDNAGLLTIAIRLKNNPVLPPPIGQDAMLNPWIDNAADFYFLDLSNTFEFKPKQGLSNQQYTRAAYTLKILKINKDPLTNARKAAFKDFSGRLKEYYFALKNGESQSVLSLIRNELLLKQHITVWREMQKQSTQHPSLQRLFALVPGADKW